MSLVQVQKFGTGTSYSLKILHKRGKRIEIKSQKILGLILTFVEVTEENLVEGLFAPPSHSEYRSD